MNNSIQNNIDLNQSNIDAKNSQLQHFFTDLQGNILKAHGRNFTNHLFIRFREGSQKRIAEFIRDFASEKITSCSKQLQQIAKYKEDKTDGGLFYSLLLTANAYKYFGLELNFENAYKEGMRNRKDLNDPKVSDWEKDYRDDYDAMILIGDNNNDNVAIAAREILEELEGIAHIYIEFGNSIRNDNGDGIEHFGYVDGVSQPLFFNDELEKYIKNQGNTNFNPKAKLNLVLVQDPHHADSYGSYFVFRKLEQNVRQFKTDEAALGDLLYGEDSAPAVKERAGALLVGRFEDGTPVTVSKKEGYPQAAEFNNFNYNTDADGAKCPFHGHIRKTNDRSDTAKKAIMARRGIPYGKRNVSTELEQAPEQMPTGGVGLLFMSFQASIENQFEVIQKIANDNTTGIDPIIGQDGNENISKGNLAVIYDDKNSMKVCEFKSSVTMKGGEYFFAPSIPFLLNLQEKPIV